VSARAPGIKSNAATANINDAAKAVEKLVQWLRNHKPEIPNLAQFFQKYDLYYARVTEIRELRAIFGLPSGGLTVEHMEAICTANGDRAKIRKNHCTFDFLIEQIANH
jgi:hypothetical protein